MKMPTLIAEVGKVHEGNMTTAKKLIKDAKKAGFDFVKFQAYKKEDIKESHANYERYIKCHLSMDQLRELSHEADKLDIGFYCSAFSMDTINQLRNFTEYIKIPSTYYRLQPFVHRAIDEFSHVHMSSGMNTFSGAVLQYSAYTDYNIAHKRNCNLVLYHCVSEYPTPPKDAKLNRLGGCHFKGYSDHTCGINAMILASIRGVSHIEKHFSTLPNATKWCANIEEIQQYKRACDMFAEYFVDKGLAQEEIDNFKFYKEEFKDLKALEYFL